MSFFLAVVILMTIEMRTLTKSVYAYGYYYKLIYFLLGEGEDTTMCGREHHQTPFMYMM